MVGESRLMGDSRRLGEGPRIALLLLLDDRCDGNGDGERKSLPAPSKATRQSPSDSIFVLVDGPASQTGTVRSNSQLLPQAESKVRVLLICGKCNIEINRTSKTVQNINPFL